MFLDTFYKTFNPEKLRNARFVPHIARRYKNYERLLIRQLMKKYKSEIANWSDVAVSMRELDTLSPDILGRGAMSTKRQASTRHPREQVR